MVYRLKGVTMAATRINDDLAAFDLLAATVKQARKDLVRRNVKAQNRVSAWQLFVSIGEQYGITTGGTTSHTNSGEVWSSSGSVCTGARIVRGTGD